MDASTVVRITPEQLAEGPSSSGMSRRQAVATDDVWAGLISTEAGMVSGWHHHGEFTSVVYVTSGVVRFEFGVAGRDSFDAISGDFVLVPPATVHRESNPTDERADAVVSRFGRGESVFNVDGPPPA